MILTKRGGSIRAGNWNPLYLANQAELSKLMVILECPTKVPGRLQVVLDWLRTIWDSKTSKTWFSGEILTENRSIGSGISKKNKNRIFPNLYENHSWRSPAHSEGPQTPKACFWPWFRSLKPQKHPWMARWHSNSWIISLNISDANGTGFSGYPTRVSRTTTGSF